MTPAMSDAPVDITSTQLEILDNAKTATFSGAVKAVQAGMVLHSDKMEVGYASQAGATPTALTSAGPGAQNLSYVTASSNVLITTPDGRKATCGQSRFDQKANTMTLQGDVVLSQGASQLHGDSVVYDMAAKKTHVSARNRVSGHFESDAVALRPASGALPAATGLSGLGAAHGATDVSADSLEIANAENLAVFQGTVIVTQQGNKLTGDRLDVDMARHHMTMTGPGRVSGVFEASAPGAAAPGRIAKVASAAPVGQDVGHSFAGMSASNGQPTNIESDSLSVEDDKGQATFNGSVVVVRGGHRITASQLTVDYGHAGAGDAAQEGSQLKRIRAKDHVIVHTPDNQVATSDWLLYDPAHNQLTMGGNVTVSQGANVVHGEKLVVDLASGESHFETRADETAAQSPATGAPASPPGRIQVLIDVGHGSQGGLRQIGGPPVAGAHAAAKPAQKEDMSASDVMVAPTEPQ